MIRVIGAIVVIFALGAVFTFYRFVSATHDPAVWHVDPLLIERPATPNTYYVAPQAMVLANVDREAPEYAVSANVLAVAFDEFIVRQPNVVIVGGSASEMWITYVQRSAYLQVPDYISIKYIPLPDGGSTVAVWSRSRFGYGDMDVNKTRVEGWLANFESLQRTPTAAVAAQ